MATVTGLTAARMIAAENRTVVTGSFDSAGHLILTKYDGTQVDVGAVKGAFPLGSVVTYLDVANFSELSLPSSYPDGISLMHQSSTATANGWPTFSGKWGSLRTENYPVPYSDNDTTQVWSELGGTTTTPNHWIRTGNSGGWSAWKRIAILDDLFAKLLAPNSIAETAAGTAYPTGISTMTLTTGSGWSQNSGFGSVVTYRPETDRTVQTFYSNPGGTGSPRAWQRHYHTSNNGGGWTAWSKIMIMKELAAADVAEANGIASWPNGWSRVYFDNLSSSGWSFAGRWGELLTYFDGGGFAKQTWTEHGSNGSTDVDLWIRSGNSGGWSQWTKYLSENRVMNGAWPSWTPAWTTSSGNATPTLGNAINNTKYYRVGRMITVLFDITFGSTTNFGTSPTQSDNWRFSLPIAASSSSGTLGFLEMRNSDGGAVASAYAWGRARLVTTTDISIAVTGWSPAEIGEDVDSLSPWTWASGDSIRGTLTYEASF